MSLETKLMICVAVAMACGFLHCALRVLGAWADHHLTRHDLIAESKRRRFEYLAHVAERNRVDEEETYGEANDSVIIEDEPEYAKAA